MFAQPLFASSALRFADRHALFRSRLGLRRVVAQVRPRSRDRSFYRHNKWTGFCNEFGSILPSESPDEWSFAVKIRMVPNQGQVRPLTDVSAEYSLMHPVAVNFGFA